MAVQLRHQAGGPNVLTVIQSGDGVAMENSADVCLVMELTPTQDTYPVVSRIYPCRAAPRRNASRWRKRHGRRRPATPWTKQTTTSNATRLKPPTGGLRCGKRLARLRRRCKQVMRGHWRPIFCLTALAYLERYSLPNAATLRLAHCERVLLPGEKIRLIYNEWRDGVKVIGVDGSLILLETNRCL